MVRSRFRFLDGLFLLPFPLLAKRFGDVDDLLVGGFGEIRVRVGTQLFDITCGAGLCGLASLDMPLLAGHTVYLRLMCREHLRKEVLSIKGGLTYLLR